jgi:hypothetical protein
VPPPLKEANVATATLPQTNVDLVKEIAKHRTNLQALETLHQQQEKLNQEVRMVLTGFTNGEAVTISDLPPAGEMVKHTDKRIKNDKSLGDLIYSLMVKKPGVKNNVRDVTNDVEATGYKSNSENFFNVVRQCLVTDARFKKVKDKGSRNVSFVLRDH